MMNGKVTFVEQSQEYNIILMTHKKIESSFINLRLMDTVLVTW
jgi:hypothetical protein